MKRWSDMGQAVVFVLLTFALVFTLIWVPASLRSDLYFYTPGLAALLMMLVVARNGALKESLQRLGLHKAGLRAWCYAVAIPLTAVGIGYLLLWMIAPATWQPQADFHWVKEIIVTAGTLAVTTVAVLGEELGWRGYLLPRLASRGRLQAGLIMGVIWSVFHFPAMFLYGIYPQSGNLWIAISTFTLTVIAATFIANELRMMTGSIWPAALFHAGNNVIWVAFSSQTDASQFSFADLLAGESGLIPLVLYALLAVWLVHKSKQAGTIRYENPNPRTLKR